MKGSDLRYIDGYLPPDIETSYRQYYLSDDIRTIRITMGLLCFLLLAFAYNDFILFGLTVPFYALIALRGAFLVYYLILSIYLNKIRNPLTYDFHLLVWLVSSLILVSVINLTRPAYYIGNFTLDVVLVLLVYLCMPTRLTFRAAGAIIFTIFEIIIFFGLRTGATPLTAFTAIVSLIAANIGGIYASSLLYRFRRREFQERIKSEELADQWQTTFDSITDLISIQDKDYRIIRANKAYLDTFHIKPEELKGKYCYETVHGTSQPVRNCPHMQTMETNKPATEEIFEPRLGIYLEISTSPILDSDGQVTGTVHLAKDITERKQMQKNLEELWTHDFLTGLPNRALLEDRFAIAAANAQRRKEKMALFTLDLDHFKLINDSLGHAAGDQVLKIAAGRLRDATRSEDTVSRIGGDEFQILMQNVQDNGNIARFADRILQAFVEPIHIEGQLIYTSASIGIAIFPENGKDLESLSKVSDEAMYQSKGKGRNCYTLYQETVGNG